MNPIALAAVLFLFLSSARLEASAHCSEDDQREGVSSVKLDRVIPPYASVYLLLVTTLVSSVIVGTAFVQEAQRIGHSTQFFVDSEPYRFASPNLSDSNFYPIPKDRITRATYMRYQGKAHVEHGYLFDPLHAALAYLFADDSVQPVEPDPVSIHTVRKEAMRVPHTDKALTEKLLGNADSRENRGHICCSWVMNEQQWPDKFVFRSEWNPGDLFCLVELHPTSFSANPGSIMGMNRSGAPFTQIVTGKGSSQENRLLIEDVDGVVELRYHADKMRIDEH
ncbi:MAG: hypothetical protein VX792_12870 [Candidatus Latescibacterota bacterium]|nr:hypothetical protein [Candidatus Latescibacterota bacterium]